MRAYDLIYKKREGGELSRKEIEYLLSGYIDGKIPDYQMAAWCMAVFFRGMTAEETALLTELMADSGDLVDLSLLQGFVADKHSTGGVGDKTTLVLAPLIAAAGLPVAKMSGRGLGHTGGTIDKLEAIPGFNTALTRQKFLEQVKEIGIAVAGQTGNLAPADKKLYALRDVTATVESIPLIASSIMSKKIAGGADGIVLDVKWGNGAFMREKERARLLAETMVEIGRNLGRKTGAILTDMNQPLGFAVGNSLEVKEALATLSGEGPADLQKLCLTLGGLMLVMADKADAVKEGKEILSDVLASGAAREKFRQLIVQQGGEPEVINNPDLLPRVDNVLEVKSREAGYVTGIRTRKIGLAAAVLGAGREKKGDSIDPAVGLEMRCKIGAKVNEGEPLVLVHHNNDHLEEDFLSSLRNCFTIEDGFSGSGDLICDIIE
ncbi:MAG: pyrimidine-nucleoside phosphorylase [Halanaerobiaceae bacterium]